MQGDTECTHLKLGELWKMDAGDRTLSHTWLLQKSVSLISRPDKPRYATSLNVRWELRLDHKNTQRV